MKKQWHSFLFLVVITVTANVIAADAEKKIDVFFDGKKVVFIHKEKITASENCFNRSSGPECEAILSLKKASAIGLEAYMKGGANPGAVVCKHSLKGTLVLGHDTFENETTYCMFKDGSYVDNGSIAYYANYNDDQAAKQKPAPFKL